MLTAENYAANLKTAARNAAAAAGVTGIDPAKWTLDQRAAYNRELSGQIIAYPNSFSPATVQTAMTINTDYGLRGNYFDSALGTALDTAAGSAREINPLDPQNVATVGKWLLVVGAILAAFWLFLRTPPPARA